MSPYIVIILSVFGFVIGYYVFYPLVFDSQDEKEIPTGLTGEPEKMIIKQTFLVGQLFTEEELSQFSYPNGTVVVDPVFTQSAYMRGGFYDYYAGKCDESCLTVKVDQKWQNKRYTSSVNSLRVFEALDWDIITDLEIHKDPAKLSKYDKVILLHSEYVTTTMFDAITSHPNVIYLYPNALYAEVEYDEDANTITLIRGHNYPDPHIANGFDWEYDNTHPYEYHIDCEGKQFYEIDNGYMLDCYPEIVILTDRELLRAIKDL